MHRLLIVLLFLVAAPFAVIAQDNDGSTSEENIVAAEDAAGDEEEVNDAEDADLDEQTYEENEDDFTPTEEISVDESIAFPTNI